MIISANSIITPPKNKARLFDGHAFTGNYNYQASGPVPLS